ncbi:MAG: hybrid sensor histidine kinase/response regulator [Lacunisphaera sp.]
MTTYPFPDTGHGPEASSTHVDGSIPLIHLIDDDAEIGAALSAGLEAHGFRTTFSQSAAAGLAAARRQYPDLILCDINMPGKNGREMLEELRRDEDLANCPFVFMTGNPLFAQPRKGMDLGADDFLLKPFSLETLVACVNARLKRSGISGQGEAALVKSLRDGLRRGLPHEFFTPLTGIIGFAEMLEQEGDLMKPEECREALRNILLSGRRLQRTLRNYIYAIDRLAPDSASPFPVLSASSVAQLFQQAARAAAERHQRGADLALEVAGAPILGSAHELTLMIEELADNAFSFSRPRSIVRIRAARVENELHVSVTDSGRGMSRQQLKNLGLFRQFERQKYEQQGLGVGLFIAQQAVRRTGGLLRFESVKDVGTTCHIILPIASEEASA